MNLTELIAALQEYQHSTPEAPVKIVSKAGAVKDPKVSWNLMLGAVQITPV